MPTQRFLNLKEEKKRLIMVAAVHEFSRVPYTTASINQIIKEAGISRGSFYTYFQDKDDLMLYLLRGIAHSGSDKAIQILKQEKGDVFAIPITLLEEFMDAGHDGVLYRMYQNMLANVDFVERNHIFGFKGFLFRDENYLAFVHRMYENMDRERFPMDEGTLALVVEVMGMLAVKSLTFYFGGLADREELLDVLKKELAILKRGACPKTGG